MTRAKTLLGLALVGAVAIALVLGVHGRIEFEGRSTQELRENELVKKYYLGV